MAPGRTPSEIPRRNRWIKPVLAVSLALNLAVVGVIGGSYLNPGRDYSPQTALSDIGFGPFIAALPGEIRRAMGRELVARAGSLRDNRHELQHQFDAMLALLRAETLDLDRLREITQAQEAKLAERQQIGRDLLYAQFAAMSAEERRAYADRLEERLKRGKRDWDRGERRPGPAGDQRPPPPRH